GIHNLVSDGSKIVLAHVDSRLRKWVGAKHGRTVDIDRHRRAAEEPAGIDCHHRKGICPYIRTCRHAREGSTCCDAQPAWATGLAKGDRIGGIWIDGPAGKRTQVSMAHIDARL